MRVETRLTFPFLFLFQLSLPSGNFLFFLFLLCSLVGELDLRFTVRQLRVLFGEQELEDKSLPATG
jgi:hypothetical protein